MRLAVCSPPPPGGTPLRSPSHAPQARPSGAARGRKVRATEAATTDGATFTPPLHSASQPGDGSANLKVAVDIDEVLGHFVPQLNKYVHDEYGESYGVEHYLQYDFKTVWGCDQDESNARVHSFFESHHFVKIPAVAGALHTLTRMKASGRIELEIVTSRQHVIEDDTREWIDMHFDGIFEAVHFGNHWAMSGPSRKKSEICADIGAEVLIDDNVGYAMDCAQAGMRVLLFDFEGSYPWSKPATPLHENVTVVHSWQEVEMVLNKLSIEKAAAAGEP